MYAVLSCGVCTGKHDSGVTVKYAKATFYEDELFLPDYEVDIPGDFEFDKNGMYLRYVDEKGNPFRITALDLADMARDGGAQSYEEWANKNVDYVHKKTLPFRGGEQIVRDGINPRERLANDPMYANPFSRGTDGLDTKKRADQIRAGNQAFNAAASSYEYQIYGNAIGGALSGTAKLGNVGKVLSNATDGADVVNTYSETLQSTPNIPGNISRCADTDDLRRQMEDAGYFDVRTLPRNRVFGKYILMSDWGW